MILYFVSWYYGTFEYLKVRDIHGEFAPIIRWKGRQQRPHVLPAMSHKYLLENEIK
jgi:hypothetical protein